MAIDINTLNYTVVNSLIELFNSNIELGERDWCLLSAVDDRIKFITLAVIDRKTSTLVPIKIDRFNSMSAHPNVIRGIVKTLLPKSMGTIKKQAYSEWDWEKNPQRAKGKVTSYDESVCLTHGGKLHLFSWKDPLIII